MTLPPRKGVSPNWSNLPRRKCDNCGKSYRPARPLRADQKYGFCKKDCNKQFYKHGAAFIQVKQAMEKEIAKRMKELEKRLREIVREEINTALPPRSDAEPNYNSAIAAMREHAQRYAADTVEFSKASAQRAKR